MVIPEITANWFFGTQIRAGEFRRSPGGILREFVKPFASSPEDVFDLRRFDDAFVQEPVLNDIVNGRIIGGQQADRPV